MEKLRIIFSKSKEALALTYMEVIDIFEEAFKNANISIEYTDTKNPKPIIDFAESLPPNIESIGEIMEVVLIEKLDIPYFVKQINKVLPSGITVLNAEYVINDNINIMDKVYASTYLIGLIYDKNKFIDKTPRQIEEIKRIYKEKLNDYLEQDKILVLKKSNSRMERIDIKSDIINFDFLLDDSLEITICSGLIKKLDPVDIMLGYREYISEDIEYTLKRIKILYR